ncbi:outer membrane protein assembly factor BamE [Acidovorax sp. BoFeN1]|jgi:outer membrane protein assembly factor BamE|uniref:outer membrane protein assembly factor BamE n=1 Tax=unclassified Acidovorax TaxID=2684926 RepID=UPI000E095C9C|nr:MULTISPECIES: outer membrane protein assembly factor BamE [unclassified Acidovorax]MCL5739621.1 outer membrane protein assembly factor BamE [Betaproteobacteria bacterium]RDD91507.1 outer membrane protein assembly factor BamE [Acidovorax sp. BoFeN1]
MPVKAHSSARLGVTLFIGVCLTAVAGCSSLDNASNRLASVVTPYKANVVQGNFVSREQIEALAPGMSRQQVRDILGTPLVTSLFHAERWEYVFTIKRPGEDLQTRKLTLFFQGDLLQRFDGDAMPSEAEFVASLGSRSTKGKVPVLEATDAQLARFPAPERAANAPAAAPAEPVSTSYPPLEAPAR